MTRPSYLPASLARHVQDQDTGPVLGLESIFRTRFGSNPKLLVLTGLNSLAVPVAPPVL